MEKNYTYPIDYEWSNEEIVIVVKFLGLVEEAYEQGVDQEYFLENYKKFQYILGSKGAEKKLGNEFMKLSGYSIYQAVKEAKNSNKRRLKM